MYFYTMPKIDQLKQFLVAQPTDAFLLHALALEYIKLGNDTDALNTFTTLLEHTPSYVGSYYHLGKLYERLQQVKLAIQAYENGMVHAKAQHENHAYSELRGSLEELTM